MNSDAVIQIAGFLSLVAIAATLVFATLYAIFGKPSTPSGLSRKRQVISGLRLTGKLLASFTVGGTLLLGFLAIQQRATRRELLLGWVLVLTATSVLSFTVRFWVVGFRYFVANGAVWSVFWILLAPKYHSSYLSAVCCAAALVAMSVLTMRFNPEERDMSRFDEFSVVVAALCLMAGVAAGAHHKEIRDLQITWMACGDVALLLSWARHYSIRQSRTCRRPA